MPRADQDFAVRFALLAMKLVDWHDHRIADGIAPLKHGRLQDGWVVSERAEVSELESDPESASPGSNGRKSAAAFTYSTVITR